MKVKYLVTTMSPDSVISEIFETNTSWKRVFDILSDKNEYFDPITKSDMEVFDNEYVSIYLKTSIERPDVQKLFNSIGIEVENPFKILEDLLDSPSDPCWPNTLNLRYKIIQNLKNKYILKFKKNVLNFSMTDTRTIMFYKILAETPHIPYFIKLSKAFDTIIYIPDQFRSFRRSRIEEKDWGIYDSEDKVEDLVSFIEKTFTTLKMSTREDISCINSQINGLFHGLSFKIPQCHDKIQMSRKIMIDYYSFSEDGYFDVVKLLFANLQNILKGCSECMLRKNSEILRKAFIAYFTIFVNNDKYTKYKASCEDILVYLNNIQFVQEQKVTTIPTSIPKIIDYLRINTFKNEVDDGGKEDNVPYELSEFMRHYKTPVSESKNTDHDNLDHAVYKLLEAVKEIMSYNSRTK